MLRQLKPRFGYGTLIALIAAAFLWWSGVLQPPQPTTDLRVVYEADNSGKLRRVEAPTSQPPARPIIKEPRLLLQHANVLQLTPQQRTRIQRIVAEWEKEQAYWLRRLRTEQARVENQVQPHQAEAVPYVALRQSLQDYSELSRAYAQAHHRAWQRAISQLSAEQKESIEKVMKEW